MSIQSEINRIAGNVSDAFDAIELKGVTVPSSATSDDLATLIGQISGGVVSITDTLDSHGGIIRTITSAEEMHLAPKSITQNGTYNPQTDGVDGYSSVSVNVSASAGGGLEYETGTWTPTEDVAQAWISFTNTHTTAPFLYYIIDSGNDFNETANSNVLLIWSSPYLLTGNGLAYSSTSGLYYVLGMYRYSNGTSLGNGNISEISAANISNWSTSTGIKAYVSNNSRYWRANRTYKWIAVWAPTT